MDREKVSRTSVNIKSGVVQPPNINPDIISRIDSNRRKNYSVGQYIDGILSGNRTILSQAITLLESSKKKHFEISQEIIEGCLPHSSNSIRIGITGVPGAGKSTFIGTFGKLMTGNGRNIAVLAIDPSSTSSNGSILGDKIRMEALSNDPRAFIRPSPSAGTLGGVARKTRETIILCEAAGFDTIIVETVGVGQSETAVSSMVDFFLLLMISGAGDELQGIKRGIMEMADAVVVNKADGDNRLNAEKTAADFRNALHYFPAATKGWIPRVMTCSSIQNSGIKEIWDMVSDFEKQVKESGIFEEKRRTQAIRRMHDTIVENLMNSFYTNCEIRNMTPVIEKKLREGTITSFNAARILLDKYHVKSE